VYHYVHSAPVAVLTQPGAKETMSSSRDEMPKAECVIQQQFSKENLLQMNSKGQNLSQMANTLDLQPYHAKTRDTCRNLIKAT